MLFNSIAFVIFFVGLYCLYLVLLQRYRTQNVLLLLASYFFYGWWDWRFLGLIAISTVVDYSIGLAMGRLDTKRATAAKTRKKLLAVSILTNLGVLGCFKYFNFFAGSAIDLLNAIGFSPDFITIEIILPVGISFYTFQTLSYSIDVYRGKLKPTKHLLDFSLFVAFFPQLVAGPIERASSLLPQIAAHRVITPERIWSGTYLILWGYFEKVVVADNLAPIANEVFNNYEKYQGIDILIGILAFALQIFGDFSGYSNIARGLARIMGFDLMVNFRLPYFATSPSDFWHRWHISLSTWLRDYLYVPLGGNRHGSFKTYRNLCITMLLGGLWHGAAWNFIFWGAYHGTGLAIHRAFSSWRNEKSFRYALPAGVSQTIKILAMFVFTLGGWLLFRATDMHQVLTMVSSLGFSMSDSTVSMGANLVLYSAPLMLVQLIQARTGNLFVLASAGPRTTSLVFAIIIVSIAILGARESMDFIYFQF